MTIDRMRQEIKMRWNKINSNHKKDLPDAYLDDILNDAINEYVEMFYSGENRKRFKLGFEVTQQRIDMLSTLVVPHKSVSATLVSPSTLWDSTYRIRFSSLDPKYRHFLRGSVIVNDCNNVTLPIDIQRHNDLDSKLNSANTKPNLLWKRCLGTIKQDTSNASADSALFLYLPEEITTNTITCEIEYLRKPVKVFSSGYDSLEYLYGDSSAYKSSNSKVNCDLPADYHTVVVDIAVQLIALMLEDNNKNLLTEEKIFKNT